MSVEDRDNPAVRIDEERVVELIEEDTSGGGGTLAEVLAAGNDPDGHHIGSGRDYSPADAPPFEVSGADGAVGGSVFLTAGDGTTGAGGAATIRAGASGDGGDGAHVLATGGYVGGHGGNLELSGGSAGVGSGQGGGRVVIGAGAGDGAGPHGIVEIDGLPSVDPGEEGALWLSSLQVVTSGYTPPSAGFTNPMTARDDLIVGDFAGFPVALPKGTDGQVLTVDPVTHHLAWSTPSAGFTNPMTTAGDILYEGGGVDQVRGNASYNGSSGNGALATDGDDATSFHPANGDNASWRAYDLGSAKTIASWRIKQSSASTTTIQTSANGSTGWTDQAFYSGLDSGPTSFPAPVTARYWRFLLQGFYDIYTFSLLDAVVPARLAKGSVGQVLGQGAAAPAWIDRARVIRQSAKVSNGGGGPGTATFGVAPLQTSLLVCLAAANGNGLSSLTQTNVTWTLVRHDNVAAVGALDVWVGVPTGTPGTAVAGAGMSGGASFRVFEVAGTTFSAAGQNIYASTTSKGATGVLRGVTPGNLVAMVINSTNVAPAGPCYLVGHPCEYETDMTAIHAYALGTAVGNVVQGFLAGGVDRAYTLVELLP